MKKWVNKVIASLIIGASLLSLVGCGGGGNSQTVTIPDGPDYSKYTDTFNFNGYSSLKNGQVMKDGMIYDLGRTFVTKETMAEYKECGMTVLLCNTAAQFNGIDNPDKAWLQVLDWGAELGLKIIVRDVGIWFLGQGTTPIVGENCQFATEAELDEYVYENYLKLYFKHPAYYGVVMTDEPRTAIVTGGAYGALYKSIMRVSEKHGVDTYILANMIGMNYYGAYSSHNPDQMHPEISREEYCSIVGITSKDENGNELSDEDFYKRLEDAVAALKGKKQESVQFEIMARRYAKRIDDFFEVTGADHYTYDNYPLYNTGPMEKMLLEFQVVAEGAKRHNADVHFVSQAMTYRPKGSNNDRILSDEDLRYLNNFALAFAYDDISYFTYFCYGDDAGGTALNGGSFLTIYGQKTDIWYYMQKIFAENQRFAPTIKQFDYQASHIYKGAVVNYPATYLSVAKNWGTLTKVKNVTVNKEHVIVNELYDDENNNYMYVVMNVVDSLHRGSKSYQTTTVTFDEQYNYALIWRNGSSEKVALDNHTLTIKNAAGEAAFVIPY
jgi:hypothetical protein